MVNNRVLLITASILLCLGVGVGLAGTTSASAQIPDIPGLPQTISGTYMNPEAGVEIVFPAGWEGMEISFEGSTIASVYPGGLSGITDEGIPVAMTLVVSDKSEVEEPDPSEPQNVPEDSTVQCGTATVGNVNVSGVTAMQSFIECTVDGTAIKTKTVMVDTEARWIIVSFMAPSAQYDQSINAVDNSIATLEVDGAIDVQGIPGGSMEIDLTSMIQTVSVAGENIDVSIRSSSTISEFRLDEENKRLSFMVDGQDGTEGTTEIAIGRILEGPYTVTIDDEMITNFEVIDGSSNSETMLKISYTHSIHEITVTGTNVVPEFPVPVLAAIATVIGVVAVLGRTRMFKPF
jgi:hypothetical protein